MINQLKINNCQKKKSEMNRNTNFATNTIIRLKKKKTIQFEKTTKDLHDLWSGDEF